MKNFIILPKIILKQKNYNLKKIMKTTIRIYKKTIGEKK